MNRLFSIGIIFFCAISCTSIESNKTLTDVESYIMERPDSALSVLESMNREDLVTHRNKAHHALLHAMALDKNFIDVTDDSIAKVAVDYYQKRGTKSKRARALYYLGKSYYYNQEYDKAILEFSKAEKIAQDCDSLYLGMIKTAKAGVYNKTYNAIEELKYTSAALDIFNAIEAEAYYRPITHSLGIAYHNLDRYADALNVYKDLMDSSSEIDYYYIKAMISAAHTLIEMDDVDYYAIDSLFRTARYEYGAEFTEKDNWAWVYSLYRIGEINQAQNILDTLETTNELVANFWKSRIAAYTKDYRSAYEYDVLTTKQQSRVIEAILDESLAQYQNDYYQSEIKWVEYQVRMRTLALIALVVFAILIFVVASLLLGRYKKKQAEEKNQLLEYAEEIKRQLEESEKNDYSELKKKFISLYKTRFETIGTLCDQYIQASGRIDIEAVMFKKVEALINDVKNDSVNRAAFETMLDKDLNMIMTRIRTEMPKMKELDYAIFSYLIVGFDATTISRLLDMTVNNVYAHKRRIRVRIEEKRPEHADQFLEMLA